MPRSSIFDRSSQYGDVVGSPVALPDLTSEEPFLSVVQKLSLFFVDAVETPHTFDELQTTVHGHKLRPLIEKLSNDVHHQAIVAALMALKYHFAAIEPDDRGIHATRGLACEVVAWRFLASLSDRETIDYCLYELPIAHTPATTPGDLEAGPSSRPVTSSEEPDEESLLLRTPRTGDFNFSERRRTTTQYGSDEDLRPPKKNEEEDPFSWLVGLNALEIAAVADAKSFLSQRLVQNIINGIWRGEIIFWDSLNVYTTKKAQIYNPRKADPYTRLRVPKYQKVFEAIFFASFLALYYAVLVQRNPDKITFVEVLLYIWIAAFAYDEFGEFQDAGTLFYATDFWSLWDVGTIAVGFAYLIARDINVKRKGIIGLAKHSDSIIDTSFDILSLEALFLVPRICSLLSLHPYFGTLIPCLKEMTKDFIKFLGLVAILYVGFLTTFTLLARNHFSLREMSWILVKVFFGSSYLGFDVARQISPVLGPPLMLVFVTMTNILLITSLVSLLSNSLTKVMDHAREEYLFLYSVFVLEASTSSRLTYYYPPLNLIPLILFRPLRFFWLGPEQLRGARIVLLKVTHLPFVAAIWAYEGLHGYLAGGPVGGRERRGYGRGRGPGAGAGEMDGVSGPGPAGERARQQQVVMRATNGQSLRALKRPRLALKSWHGSLHLLADPTATRSRSVDQTPQHQHYQHHRDHDSSAPSSDLRELVDRLSLQLDELATALTAMRHQQQQHQRDQNQNQDQQHQLQQQSPTMD